MRYVWEAKRGEEGRLIRGGPRLAQKQTDLDSRNPLNQPPLLPLPKKKRDA